MSAPLYQRGDTVYLRSSAEIGQLDSFRIDGAKSNSAGVWSYRVDIGLKPPTQPTVGDRVDPRLLESRLYYAEGDFVTLCEALNIIVARLEQQSALVQSILDDECSGSAGEDPVAVGHSKFDVGDQIWVTASAKIGFLESRFITEVFEIGIQPGSGKTRYLYKLRHMPKQLTFHEWELSTKCEAVQLAIGAVNRQLNLMRTKQDQVCS